MNSLLDLLIEEKRALRALAIAEETNDWTGKDQAETRLKNVRIEIKFYIEDLGFTAKEEE